MFSFKKWIEFYKKLNCILKSKGMKNCIAILMVCFLFFNQSLVAQEQNVRKRGSKKQLQESTEKEVKVKENIEEKKTTSINGVIKDESGEGLPSAIISILGTPYGTLTQLDGSFNLKDVPKGNYQLKVSYVGFQDVIKEITISDEPLSLGEMILKSDAIGLEEIQVVASYVTDRKTPNAVSSIDLRQIQEQLGSQEIPMALKLTPSVYTSNAGGGFGDSRINVRGFQQEEIAVLINGVPINDMAAGRVFWSNWQGLADYVRNIQIQRGLGASRLAISSIGGTMNFITKTTDAQKGGSILMETSNIYDLKTVVTLSTGLSPKGWAMTVSGGRTVGKGYIENLFIDVWSYYFSVSKQVNSKHLLTFNAIGAPQKHGQRFQRLSEKRYKELGNRFANVDFGYLNGQKVNNADNFYHKPQLQLNHYWDITEKSKLSTNVYASWGRGGGSGTLGKSPSRNGVNGTLNWEALQAENRNGVDTLLTPNGRTIGYNSVGILRNSHNDHNWYGILSTFNTQLTENLNFIAGIDGRLFDSRNYRKIKNLIGGDYWIEKNYANDSTMYLINVTSSSTKIDTIKNGRICRPGDIVDYDYRTYVNWAGAFSQIEYNTQTISAYLNLAVSNTWQKRKELMRKTDTPESETKTFFAYVVKGGMSFSPSSNHTIFINGGHFTRAPFLRFSLVDERTKNEFVNNLKNEKVYSAEIGYNFQNKFLTLNFNAYYTQWKDKGVRVSYNNAQGQLAYANIAGMAATHMGIELDGKIRPFDKITLNYMFHAGDWKWTNDVSATVINENDLSTKQFNLYLKNIKVGDSPQTTGSLGFQYNFTKDLYLGINSIYYANMYANFNPETRTKETDRNQSWKMPDFMLFDLHAGYYFNVDKLPASIKFHVFNLLDKAYFMEAQDGLNHDRATSTMFYGYGRVFNVSLNLSF